MVHFVEDKLRIDLKIMKKMYIQFTFSLFDRFTLPVNQCQQSRSAVFFSLSISPARNIYSVENFLLPNQYNKAK